MIDKTPDNIDDLELMRKRYQQASDACKDLYADATNDIKFVSVPGCQWDDHLRGRRSGRPTYEFPKLGPACRQVINEFKQSPPQGKVRGVEESDRGLAEIMQGLCRNIESSSDSELAYDIAFEMQVKGGYGVWRLCTDYRDDKDFEQDIFIEPVYNPFAVKFDAAATKQDKSDANFVFFEDLISKEDFEHRWPDKSLSEFETDTGLADWLERGLIRVCEYWYKKPIKDTMWALSDGRVLSVDELYDQLHLRGLITEEQDGDLDYMRSALASQGVQVVKEREVDSHEIVMRITNGKEWLSEECEFPSKYFPFVPVYSNYMVLDGKEYWHGLVRPNKDGQRLHNVHRTAAIEAVAKAPKAPFIVKQKWIKGLERFWNNANAEDYPFLPVNDEAEAMPVRSQQAEIPAAMIQLSNIENEDIKAGTGIFDASLGAQSNETSGKAINARKLQGATATYNYIDSFAHGVKHCYRIMLDMLPRVMDTARTVRILGPDGGEKWKQLYQEVADPQTGYPIVLNDIKKGKYDVAITVGPSYATQRMEAVEAFSQLAGQLGGAFPPLAAIMAYQVVHNLDLPGSEEVDKAVRKILVKQGLVEPQDGDEPPQPPQPNPKDVADAKAKESSAMLNFAKAEGQQIQNQADALALHVATQPPPMPQMMPPEQSPQGGFLMPQEGMPTG